MWVWLFFLFFFWFSFFLRLLDNFVHECCCVGSIIGLLNVGAVSCFFRSVCAWVMLGSIMGLLDVDAVFWGLQTCMWMSSVVDGVAWGCWTCVCMSDVVGQYHGVVRWGCSIMGLTDMHVDEQCLLMQYHQVFRHIVCGWIMWVWCYRVVSHACRWVMLSGCRSVAIWIYSPMWWTTLRMAWLWVAAFWSAEG